MTFLDQLLERRALQGDMPINGTTLANILGGIPAVTGKVVNPSTALQLTAVYACISLLSETFASLPAILYRRLDQGKKRAPNHPLYSVLHDIANPEMTSVEFRSTMLAHSLLWGHCYAEVVRNGAGEIKQLWPLPPMRVLMGRNKRNELIYQVTLPNESPKNLRADRVLHISEMLGLSPISQAREALGLTMAAEEYGARFFANDSRPGGILEHPGHLSKEASDRLRAQWESNQGGLSNKHRTVLLEEGLKWTQMGLAPEDSQFLETRRFQVSEIARIFRVPPHMIGDVERSTSWGTGIEQQNIGFVIYSLRSRLVRWEQEINKTLLTSEEQKLYFVEFLVEGLLRGDYKTRQEGLAIQRQNGVVNADEWRELENMNPIPGGKGKIYLMNAAMIPVDDIGKEPPKSEPEPEEKPDEEGSDDAATETEE